MVTFGFVKWLSEWEGEMGQEKELTSIIFRRTLIHLG